MRVGNGLIGLVLNTVLGLAMAGLAQEITVSSVAAGIEAAAGTGNDVDTEELKKEFRRQRDVTTRPPDEALLG